MRTLADSELAVSVYPSFAYNSLGGGGIADATVEGRRVNITFNPTSVNIPPVDARTTKFLGVPMVPGLRIDVVPAKLEVRLSCFVAASITFSLPGRGTGSYSPWQWVYWE